MQVQDYLKHGLVAGTLLVITEYVQKILYYQNDIPYNHNTALMLWSYLAIIILSAVCYWAVVTAREDKPGLKFGSAFFVSIYVVFIASLMVGGFYFLYAKYIDPSEADRMAAYWIDKMRAEKIAESEIDEKIKRLRMGYTASSQFLLGLKYLVYGLFISLVIAAFTTRKRKMIPTSS